MRLTRRSLTVLAAASGMGAAPPLGPAWQFRMPSIEEGTLDFADFRGRVLLVVNTASFCGFTPQYRALEALHRNLGPRGFAVIGIPSQDFGQEKDSNAEVKAFCDLTYGVEFPMSGIAHVRGPDAAPFYKWVKAQTGWEPHWNFFKALVGRDGALAGTWDSQDEPDHGPVRSAIEAALERAA